MDLKGYVPTINLQSKQSNSLDLQAKAIRRACEETGFFAVSGHGVSTTVMGDCANAARIFFEQPIKEKRKVQQSSPRSPYGFIPMAQETLGRSRGAVTPPDLKESFSIGPSVRARPPKNSEEAIFSETPNRWPQIPKNFRESFEIYYKGMNNLSNKLMHLFALALNLPKDFFLPYIGHPISALRANHYPAISSPHLKGQLRAGEHSDYGTLTILMQDSSDEGLEIYNRGGIWIPVAIKAPKLIINIGDLMQRWTNNRWVSSLHRVVVPSDNPSQKKCRISIAYFHQPNWDAVIRCIPSCKNPNKKPFYLPIRSGAYLMSKFHSTTL